MIRRISVRNVVAGTLAAMAASALFLAPQAAADPGDVTFVHTSTNVEFATDACKGASGQVTMEGAPSVPDTYFISYGGGSGCTVRARFVGVRDDGRTPFDSGYQSVDGAGGFLSFGEVYRCHVEFGVRRTNGTFYTQIVRPIQPEVQNCPR